MRKLFSLFLVLVATASLWAQRFEVNGIYYKTSTKDGIISASLDTIGWNIPSELLLTVSQAREICSTLESEATSGKKYYVMGYVKKLHSKHAEGVTNYGNAQFYMEDVRGANSSEDLLAFQVYGPNGKKITNPDAVAVGDFVVVYGELTNYNGTYETVGQGRAHIWKSSNPLFNDIPNVLPEEPEELVIPEEAKAWNIPAEAIDVIKAREICASLAAGDSTAEKYYVMGYVKKLHSKHAEGVTNYGNAQFFMENVKGKNSNNDFIAFQVFGPNGTKITDPAIVEEGDFVVVYGRLTNYMGCTYETTGKGSAYIWKSTNPLCVAPEQEPVEITVFDVDLSTKGVIDTFAVANIAGSETWKYVRQIVNTRTEIKGANNEDWLITPALDLTGMSEAKLNFKYKFSDTILAEYQKQYTVLVSKDYDGNIENIKNATWVELNGFSYENLTYIESGAISLPQEMIGHSCYIAWRYATTDVYHTWSLQNIAIKAIMSAPKNMSNISAKKNYAKKTQQNEDTPTNYVVVTYQSLDQNNYSHITTIDIPETVEYEGIIYKVIGIGYNAFYNNQTIDQITIPQHINSIGDAAFGSVVSKINFEALTPPTVTPYTFASTSATIYVPCDCVGVYQSVFNKPVQEHSAVFNVQVSPTENGYAEVLKNTLCGAQICATPNFGYHFSQWSDGNTDNPRTLVLTQDTTLTAEFALTYAGQCGDNLYWAYDENSKAISITGSGMMYDYTATTQPWLLFKEQIVEVITSNTATSIGTSAFEGCIRLGKVSLGAAMENIAANAFAACKRLYDIYVYATYPPFAEESSFANYNVYLYIPCENQRDYILDVVWGEFKFIECIGAEPENMGGDSVVINTGSTDVTIIWPTEENADTYSIVIKKDGKVVCTLTFNSEGQLLNIAFAPGRNGNHPAQYAEAVANGGFRFTVTGLEEGTDYTYDITVKDAANKTISEHSGEFTTNSATALDNTHSPSPMTDCQKLLRNGQLIILRDGVEYNAMGQEL